MPKCPQNVPVNIVLILYINPPKCQLILVLISIVIFNNSTSSLTAVIENYFVLGLLFFPLFRVLSEVSAVPLRFMESRERCFLPVLVCAGPGPAGLGGTPLLSGKPALGETAPL